jgi:hypothetical protein
MFVAFLVLALLSLWALVGVTVSLVIQIERSRNIGQRAVGARLACRTCGAHVAVLTQATVEPERTPLPEATGIWERRH